VAEKHLNNRRQVTAMEKTKIIEIIRFFIGLAIIGYASIVFALMLMAKGALGMFLFALITPYGFPVIFACVPGLYFMFTSKIRWKADVLMGILAVLSIIFTTTALIPEIMLGDISGNNPVLITVVDRNNIPLVGLEVDIGAKPGPPPKGGVATTDENGTAHFSLKAGTYYVYFNSNNFPKEYKEPSQFETIEVIDGKIASKTIVLEKK